MACLVLLVQAEVTHFVDESQKGRDEILTLPEVGKILRVHRSTLYRLIQRGDLPVFRVGSDFRVSRRSLERWLANRHTTSGTPPFKR